MARSSVLDARRGWIRSTGPARHGSGRSSAPLRSHRVRLSVAHRTCAALSRTSTTVGGGVPSPPAAFVADSFMVCCDLSGRARCTRVPRSRSPSAGCACAARSRLDKPRHSGRTRAGSAQTRSLALAIVAGGQTEATSGGGQTSRTAARPCASTIDFALENSTRPDAKSAGRSPRDWTRAHTLATHSATTRPLVT